MGSYTWNITDKALIKQIKNAKEEEAFYSPPFRCCNLTFEIELYPNGSEGNKGDVQIFLNITGLSSKVKSIVLKRKYKFLQLDVMDEYKSTITQEDLYCFTWPEGTVKTTDIQKLNAMTLKVDVVLYNVFDKDDEDITDKYLLAPQLDSCKMSNKKRNLNGANINIEPPKKKRKLYSNENNTNNNTNIDQLIEQKIEELNEISNALSDLQRDKKNRKDFKNMYEKEKKENDNLNKINSLINNKCNKLEETNKALNEKGNKLAISNEQMTNELQESHEQMEIFKEEINTLNQKIKIYNGTSYVFGNNTLNLEQLSKFEKELMNGMQCISTSREKLLELQNKCVACKENNKNMVFLDGCNHFAMCMECENKMDTKQCPMCRTPYTTARKLSL